ncbi:MAG: multidrug effflux MFS transporter [Acidimicrobiales bacterium]
MTATADRPSAPVRNAPVQVGKLSERELLTMISAIMALMALAIDMMLPAFDDMRSEFGLADGSNEVAQVITVFFFGLAVAQLFYGPLADRYGRKPILYSGIVIYLIGAVGSALSPSLEWLLVSRFVWGVGAAGARVVATAIVRDVFAGTRMAKALSQIMAVFVLVPVIAPTLGAGIILVLPWRSIFWACVVWTIIVTVWSFRLPETLDPANRRPLEARVIADGYRTVASNRLTAGYTLATVFLQGVFTTYLATSELIIGEIFGRGDQFPLVFGAVALLFGLGAFANGNLVGRIGLTRLTHRVAIMLLTGTVLLVVMSLASDGRPPFWLFMPLLGLSLSLFMFLMPNLNSAAMAPLGEVAGSASSLTGAARMAGGAVLGGIASGMVSDSVTPFAVAMLVFVAAAVACVFGAERFDNGRNELMN